MLGNVKWLLGVPARVVFPDFWFSTATSSSATSEQISADRITDILRKRFGESSTQIDVEDISGGCGAMFRVFVAAPEFSGVPKVGQHKAITEALKDEIKSMHGITIETKAIRKDTGE